MLILYLCLELAVQGTALNWGWGWRLRWRSNNLLSSQKKPPHAQSLNWLWCHSNQVAQSLDLSALPSLGSLFKWCFEYLWCHTILHVSSVPFFPSKHLCTDQPNSRIPSWWTVSFLVTLTKSVGKLARIENTHYLRFWRELNGEENEWRGTICRNWGRIQSTHKDDKVPGNVQQ